MNTSVWAVLGAISLAVFSIVRLFLIVFQTTPTGPTLWENVVSLPVLILGVAALDISIVQRTQERFSITMMAVLLVIIGIVGFGMGLQAHNAIIELVYPRTNIVSSMYYVFWGVTMMGVLMPIMSRALNKSPSS